MHPFSGPATIFNTAAATLTGAAHRQGDRGNQDAWARVHGAGVSAVAVADGCSEGAGNALGAALAARLAVACSARRVASGASLAELPTQVLHDVVGELARLARACALDDEHAGSVVGDALLATVHVAVACHGAWCVFGVGDGVVLVDDVLTVLDEGAAPDYPAYALFPALPAPRLRVHHLGPVARGIVLGTDGCKELLARQHEPLPDGTPVGDLAAHLRDTRWSKNPSLVQKRLRAWAAEHGAPRDDCTLVVLRRSP